MQAFSAGWHQYGTTGRRAGGGG